MKKGRVDWVVRGPFSDQAIIHNHAKLKGIISFHIQKTLYMFQYRKSAVSIRFKSRQNIETIHDEALSVFTISYLSVEYIIYNVHSKRTVFLFACIFFPQIFPRSTHCSLRTVYIIPVTKLILFQL